MSTKNLSIPKSALFIIIFVFCTCNRQPKEVRDALHLMRKENMKKFEKVFEHFSQPSDSLKLKAAYFFVENMNGLGSYKGSQIDDYNVIYDILANKPSNYWKDIPWYSKDIGLIFDSLKAIYGPMDFRNLYFVKDEDAISSDYLIQYINEAFEAWHNPWSRKVVSFSDFCNYVLPYRNFDETLEPWRGMFTKKYHWIYDNVKPDEDIIDVARRLDVGSELRYSDGFGNYIVTAAPSLLLKARYGTCTNTANFKSMIMRAHGIPATIDYLPQYGADHNHHYWNSVMDKYGNFVSFDEALRDSNAVVAYKYKISKAYRRTFARNKNIELLIKDTKGDLPENFRDPRFIDVTGQYVAVTNVKVRLKNVPAKRPYVYVGIFNDNGWTIIDYAKIFNSEFAQFNNLGRDVVYLPLYFVNGQQIVAASPFKITKKGFIQYLEPEKEITTIKLTRKYHMYPTKLNWMYCLKDARFEGANRPDFSDAVTLARIDHIPGEHFQQLNSNSDKSFKFLRLIFSPQELDLPYDDGDGTSIAEIEFISQSGQIIKGKAIGSPGRKYNPFVAENCFDSNPLTFFQDSRPAAINKYVGLKLDVPARIMKIRFLARNDMNSVQPGDEYELLCWEGNSFKSLGKKVANDTLIEYDNVPKNSLLWLRDLSAGKEERIFTWEDGKQVWW